MCQHHAAQQQVILYLSICADMCLIVAGPLWWQFPQSGAIVFLYVSVCAYTCLSVLMCV